MARWPDDQIQGSIPVIRLATPEDAAAIAAVYGPYVASTVISFEVVPPDAAEMQKRVAAVLARLPWLVCERDRRVVGYAYASPHHVRAAYQWSVDTAVYVSAEHHGVGVGRELYGALFPLLLRLGYVNAYAGITLPNPKSVGLHESFGFEPLGVYRHVGFKFGQWHDVGWWSLPLQPLPASPRPPLALHELQV
jgi:L-amino acid N-acyltransferase YncA